MSRKPNKECVRYPNKNGLHSMKLGLLRNTLFILLMVFPLAAIAQPINVISLERPTDISGIWKYKIGDDMSWASPNLNDSHWAEIAVPMD